MSDSVIEPVEISSGKYPIGEVSVGEVSTSSTSEVSVGEVSTSSTRGVLTRETSEVSTSETSSTSGAAFSVDECWLGEWLGRTVLVADGRGIRIATDADPAPSTHLAGTLLPGFRDAHVHLGLVDGSALPKAGIAAVDDFGWDLDTARGWPMDAALPAVRFAGRLLTAPGGYPSGSGWAPSAAIEEVASQAQAAAAVNRQLDAGASFIKVTLNSDAGPVLDAETLLAIVEQAHDRGVTVAAHAQGAGQAARAFAAGVDHLAHAPWGEILSDELLCSMARSQTWVSTLDIHGWGNYGLEFETAQHNVRRFVALGGTVSYGTDLGNGPLPLGINERELRALSDAGLGPDALVAAIATTAGAASTASTSDFGHRASYIAGDRTDDTAAWLAAASVLTTETLEGFRS